MNPLRTIFVVIDPTTSEQRALDRAREVAAVTGAKIHAFCCTYSSADSDDKNALREAEVRKHELWVDELLAQARADGLEATSQVEWNKDWYSTIAPAAKAADSDLIVKSSRSRGSGQRILMVGSDLAVFKTAHCPVLLTKSQTVLQTGKVLVAIDANRTDKRYLSLRDNVIEYGKAVTSSVQDGELHVVQAYSKQSEFVHVSDLVKLTGVDSSRIHVASGDSIEEAIVNVAEKIQAQIVIIGLSTKSTLSNRVFGSTGEWLLNNLDEDLLVVFPETT